MIGETDSLSLSSLLTLTTMISSCNFAIVYYLSRTRVRVFLMDLGKISPSIVTIPCPL
jgi:hypothetical protein